MTSRRGLVPEPRRCLSQEQRHRPVTDGCVTIEHEHIAQRLEGLRQLDSLVDATHECSRAQPMDRDVEVDGVVVRCHRLDLQALEHRRDFDRIGRDVDEEERGRIGATIGFRMVHRCCPEHGAHPVEVA